VAEVGGVTVACIQVPKARHGEVATQGGVYLRRRIKHDGTPECAPMLPHERTSRRISFGLVDVSAQPVAGATLADFDPLERERLRQAVQQYGGDRVLLELDDEALDGALGLTARQPMAAACPRCGLLLVGREMRCAAGAHARVRLPGAGAAGGEVQRVPPLPAAQGRGLAGDQLPPLQPRGRVAGGPVPRAGAHWWTWAPSARPWPMR
jgi:hypothetical protein